MSGGSWKTGTDCKSCIFWSTPDHLFTPVTHIKFQFNFQIYLTNADVTIFCNNTDCKLNTTIACQMAGRGTRYQSNPVANIIWAPQKNKHHIENGESLLGLNDEKNLQQTMNWIKAMY